MGENQTLPYSALPHIPPPLSTSLPTFPFLSFQNTHSQVFTVKVTDNLFESSFAPSTLSKILMFMMHSPSFIWVNLKNSSVSNAHKNTRTCIALQ